MAQPGRVLVRTSHSLISAGTEGASVSMSRRSLVEKAMARPDLVKQVVDKARRDGLGAAYVAASTRLDSWDPLGYSLAGTVVEVGAGVGDIAVGARVACAGAGFANHAEVVSVPRNLCVPIPEGVASADAAYTTLGAIALHGVRQAEATIGSVVAVVGLGLVGQLAAQILRAAGCRVLGVEPSADRRALADQRGATAVSSEGAVPAALAMTEGRGVDAVILTAATASSEPIEQAADLARDRANVVVLGAVGLDIPREPYYRKELQVRLSRSYGPGRYDREYEEGGRDYPIGYVRWTENRNMVAFLELLRAGSVEVGGLTTHTFDFAEAPAAYSLITERREPFLGVALRYPEADAQLDRAVRLATPRPVPGSIGVGFIGAGNFAQATLLPAVRAVPDVALRAIATATGNTAVTVGQRAGFEVAASDPAAVYGDPETRAVFIATRHDSHAELTSSALRAGKAVYCEKPLALTEAQLNEVLAAAAESGAQLMTGYNRRFAPLTVKLVEALAGRTRPLLISCRVNAGPLADDHWLHDPSAAGGRILAEACHFVDLAQFLADAAVVEVRARALRPLADRPSDEVIVDLTLADGSQASVLYSGGGDGALPKERVEVFGAGTSAVLDDFRLLEVYRDGRRIRSTSNGDKGHRAAVAAFLAAVKSGREAPIPIEHQRAAALATIRAVESLVDGAPRSV